MASEHTGQERGGQAPRASVILATKDRGEAIGPTIESLLRQDYGDFEVVIVDNCSGEEDAHRLQAIAARWSDVVRYVREPNLGLSNARNAGVRAARGELHAFLDDDAIAPPHWLANLVRAFDENPSAWVVGSRVVARFTTPAPDWLDDRFALFLSSFDRGDDVRRLYHDDYPRGANMAFRRRVFEDFGMFLDCLGRKGASLLSYEEIELCYRVERGGHEILYVPDAEVDHLIRGDRLTPEWFERRFHWQGRSAARFERIHFGALYLLRKLPFRLLRSVVGGDRYSRRLRRGLVVASFANLFRTTFV